MFRAERGGPPPSPLPPLTPRQAREFERLRRQWRSIGESAAEIARARPSDPNVAPDVGVEELLASGRSEVDRVRAEAARFGVPFRGPSALDFGCGPGRMTQALQRHFDSVVGVDVAPAMVALANEINRRGPSCQFVLADAADLARFPSGAFSTTFSVYVLQHLPRWLATRYLREFVRVTRPGGSVVVQVHAGPTSRAAALLPESCLAPVVNLGRSVAGHGIGRARPWDVHWMSPSTVRAHLTGFGATVRGAQETDRPDGRLRSFWYYATVDDGNGRPSEPSAPSARAPSPTPD